MPGPSYLTGEQHYLRAPVLADAEVTAAWFPDRFPVNATRAEAYLKETLTTVWSTGANILLMVVRSSDDQVVGSVRIEHPTGPAAQVDARFAPTLSAEDMDGVQADVLAIINPWLFNEAEVLTITIGVGADQPRTLAAASVFGMTQQVRLREYLARPGGRTDLIQLQAVSPRRAPRMTDPHTGERSRP